MKKRKLKIAFFHCSFVYSGGGERIALEGVLGLRDRGHKVDLFAPAINWKKCFPDLLKKAKPKTIIPQFSNNLFLEDAWNMLFSSFIVQFVAYKFKKYDIFIGENQPGVWFAWNYAKTWGKPYIIYLNQPNRLIYPRSIDKKTGWNTNLNFAVLDKVIKLVKPIVSFFDRKSIQESNIMMVNGTYIGNVISQIYGKEYVECPAGCDPFPHGKLTFTEKKYFEGILKVNKHKLSKPYLLITNRHYPQKRFDYAIRALPNILKKHPKIQLVITGDATKSTIEWKKIAKDLKVEDNIIWLGEVENSVMGELYENAAVYLYTSPEEDYGMGVVEAEEFGIPVVAWNHAGPTVTVKNRLTGFLAKPYDVKDFAKQIITLLDNPEKRVQMGKNAHEHVQKNFTWKRHVDILEESLYKALEK